MSGVDRFRGARSGNPLSWAALVIVAAAYLALVNSAQAQAGDELHALRAEVQALQSEIEGLKSGQEAMQKDLAAIKQLLEQRQQAAARPRKPPFEPLDLDIADAPTLGTANAPVTLVEFTDYQCPFCRRHDAQVRPALLKAYVETGKLKYVVREFPIAQLHPRAPKAAEAALCAADQGRYWEMHEVMFANQEKLSLADLAAHAGTIGLDVTTFKDCLDGGKYAGRVQVDLQAGRKARVSGTPTFFLGLSDPNAPGKLRATERLIGAQPYDVFRKTIEALLAKSANRS
jgi:protein-disulfide isomerase